MIKKLLLAVASLVLTMGFAFAAVDANKATSAELDAVKGIGPALSKKIIDERTKGGNFKSWADFETRVSGVGEKSGMKLSEAGLTVNGAKKAGTAAAMAADSKDDVKAAKKDAKADAKEMKKDAKADAKEMKKDAKADAKEVKAVAKADAEKAKASVDKNAAVAKAEVKKDAAVTKAEVKKDAAVVKAEAKKDEKAASGTMK
jgi:competence protein ComEA